MERMGSERELWVRWRGVGRVLDRLGHLYVVLADLADDLRSMPGGDAPRHFAQVDDLIRRLEPLHRAAVDLRPEVEEILQGVRGGTGRPPGWRRREDHMLWSGPLDPLRIHEREAATG